MRHLFPLLTATQRRHALAEAEAREAAEHDRAVQRIIGVDVAAVDKRGGPTAATRPDEP